MTNIYHLDIPFKSPLNSDLITDDLIDILYDFLPAKFSFWSLKLAQSRFNERQQSDAATWLDKLQVYVGLPDWVVTEEQMYSECVYHLKCPFGILEDLTSITEVNLNCAMTHAKTDILNGKRYDALIHTTAFELEIQAVKLDSDILNAENDFEYLPDEFETLHERAIENVFEKSQYLGRRILRERKYTENITTLKTALETCLQLSKGDIATLEAFIGVKLPSVRSVEEARSIYSNLDIEDFYEWASHHFALDEFYDDSEDLVDHINGLITGEQSYSEIDQCYLFAATMIGRSEPINAFSGL